MDVLNYIPKNKGDQTVIKELKELSYEQIKPIIPQLLEWLQDVNWPIAGPVSKVLIPFVDNIVPDII